MKDFNEQKASVCPHCGGPVEIDIWVNVLDKKVESVELIKFSNWSKEDILARIGE